MAISFFYEKRIPLFQTNKPENKAMIHADLHIHSHYSSDGEFDITTLANRCANQKVDYFSLTDHNSVKGTPEAILHAQHLGLHFIPGIEIDCNYEGTDLHILGYHIDWKSGDFQELEKSISSKVMDSFSEMIGNLHKLGFTIDAEAVLAKANGKLPTGELIAEVMLSDKKYDSPLLAPYQKGGARSDMPYINFYLDYFAQHKPAFVPIRYMSFREAVELIKTNSGIPVVAHPGLNLKGRESIVEQLLDKGAEGLEVFNNYHNPEQINYFASLIRQKKAIMTCGSDFHGKTKPLIQIGQYHFSNQYEKELQLSLRQIRNKS